MKILKKFTRIWLLVAFLVSLAVANDKFQALEVPLKNEQNSVIETFSFWCGGCYYHHQLGTLAKIKEKLPNLKYKVYPFTDVQFGEEFGKLYAYAQSKDEAAGLDGTQRDSAMYKLADVYFVALFKRKQNFTSSQNFIKLGLKTLDISQKELDNFIASPKGKQIYAEYDKANIITKAYGGTPSFSVNGKYFIIMKNIHGLDEMVEVIKDASKK